MATCGWMAALCETGNRKETLCRAIPWVSTTGLSQTSEISNLVQGIAGEVISFWKFGILIIISI